MYGERGGAPSGARNGDYRHGEQAQARKAVWAEIMELVRMGKETGDALAEWRRRRGR